MVQVMLRGVHAQVAESPGGIHVIRIVRTRLHAPEWQELCALSDETGTSPNLLIRRAVQLLLADRELTYADGSPVKPV
jgi:hypothetical protein